MCQAGEVSPALLKACSAACSMAGRTHGRQHEPQLDTSTDSGDMQGGMRRAQGLDLSIPVALLHVAAFSMGYFICKGLGFNEKTSRTVSIETGAQLKNWAPFLEHV